MRHFISTLDRDTAPRQKGSYSKRMFAERAAMMI
jgi:hypothetical protein